MGYLFALAQFLCAAASIVCGVYWAPWGIAFAVPAGLALYFGVRTCNEERQRQQFEHYFRTTCGEE